MRGVAKECKDGCIGFGEMCWCRTTMISGTVPADKVTAEETGGESADAESPVIRGESMGQ